MKKLLLSCLALLLILSLLCSCTAFKITDVSVVATANGEDILTEEFDYFLLFAKQSILANAGATADSKEFWETTEIDGKNAGDLAKENALNDAINYTLIAQKARAMGISTDTPEAREQISSALSSAKEFSAQYGISEDALKSVINKLYLESQLIRVMEEKGEIDVSEENLKNVYEKNFRTIKHILYSLTDPETNSQFYTEEEAYQMAVHAIDLINSGENFDDIMKSSSMDPGLANSPDGYTFTNNGTMVAPFETAAFKLEIGQISEPVPTSYGCHVLKREPLVDFEVFSQTQDVNTLYAMIEEDYIENLVSELKAQSTIEKNEKSFNKISLY